MSRVRIAAPQPPRPCLPMHVSGSMSVRRATRSSRPWRGIAACTARMAPSSAHQSNKARHVVLGAAPNNSFKPNLLRYTKAMTVKSLPWLWLHYASRLNSGVRCRQTSGGTDEKSNSWRGFTCASGLRFNRIRARMDVMEICTYTASGARVCDPSCTRTGRSNGAGASARFSRTLSIISTTTRRIRDRQWDHRKSNSGARAVRRAS